MASEQEQLNITLKAEGDLSGKQYRAMQIVNSGYGTTSVGTADYIVGILQNKPNAYGRPALIVTDGHTKAIAGGAISTIGYVGIHSDGAIQGVSTSCRSIIGVNLTTAAGSGEYVEMLLGPFKHT